jgi:chromosome segregation ATPase
MDGACLHDPCSEDLCAYIHGLERRLDHELKLRVEADEVALKYQAEADRLRAEAEERSGYLTEQYNLNAALVEKVGRLQAEYDKFFDLWQDKGDEVERLRAQLEQQGKDNEELRVDKSHFAKRAERAENLQRQAEAEVKRLRPMEEPLATLYRFVMESWYARSVAVPSGVLERARLALKGGGNV